MPFDGHSYLVSQGWSGTGTGLRQGSISRPLAIPQKKTLAGLGKDRDEAFPFWDHLFAAAASAIQVKISSDDENEQGVVTSTVELKRTATGILSNRRPLTGTPAFSGTATPSDSISDPFTSRLGLMALAKREAAKRGLYSRFFRGPVIGPDDVQIEMVKTEAVLIRSPERKTETGQKTAHSTSKDGDDNEVAGKRKRKKRKADEAQMDDAEARRQERKRQKKELKEAEKTERKAKRKEEKREAKEAAVSHERGEEDPNRIAGTSVDEVRLKKKRRGGRKKEKRRKVEEVVSVQEGRRKELEESSVENQPAPLLERTECTADESIPAVIGKIPKKKKRKRGKDSS
ncbi:hypothetical protein EW146_g1216 [Bondarzewia mesenterica]|uniref:G-patch domain-containing protein n=1 Tax=Bondarzewia mesenterica TaxID=1095465 RepID=A0A4S4M4Q6_9AGAM|nr:hypothetical protein EW146_g1216 [Bondarzewia mesenterica]